MDRLLDKEGNVNPFLANDEKINFPPLAGMPLMRELLDHLAEDDGDVPPEDDIEYLAEVRGRPFVLPGDDAAMWHPHSPVGCVTAVQLDADRVMCERFWAAKCESPVSVCSGGGGVTVRDALQAMVAGEDWEGRADDGEAHPCTPLSAAGRTAACLPYADALDYSDGPPPEHGWPGSGMRCLSDRSQPDPPRLAGALHTASPFSALPACLTDTGTPAPRCRSRTHCSDGGVEDAGRAHGRFLLQPTAADWEAAGVSPIPAPTSVHGMAIGGGYPSAGASTGRRLLQSCVGKTREPTPSDGSAVSEGDVDMTGIARNLCPTLDASLAGSSAARTAPLEGACEQGWSLGWRSAVTTHVPSAASEIACHDDSSGGVGGSGEACDLSMGVASSSPVGCGPSPCRPRVAHLSPLHAVREARVAANVTSPAATWDYAAWSTGRLTVDQLCDLTRAPAVASSSHVYGSAGECAAGQHAAAATILPHCASTGVPTAPPHDVLASLRLVAGRMDAWQVPGRDGGTDGSVWAYPRGLFSSPTARA